MSNISHEVGATIKNLEVTGVTFPAEHLVMLINANSMAAYASGAEITTLPNQAINANLANFTYLSASYYDPASAPRVTLAASTLNGKKLVKMATRYLGSPYYAGGWSGIRRYPNGPTGYPYSPGISGITRSLLVYPDKSLYSSANPSAFPASKRHEIGFVETTSGNYTGLITGTESDQWVFYTGGAYTTQNLGLAPEIDAGWYHFIIVESGGENRSVQVYVNGVLLFDASLPDRTFVSNVVQINHVGKGFNQIGGTFNGYYAHGATWFKPLSIEEINAVIDTINHIYGLSNPQIEA